MGWQITKYNNCQGKMLVISGHVAIRGSYDRFHSYGIINRLTFNPLTVRTTIWWLGLITNRSIDQLSLRVLLSNAFILKSSHP